MAAAAPPDGARRQHLRAVGLGVGLVGLMGPGGLPLALASSSGAGVVEALRQGGCAVLMRHALTVPGVGDPQGFRLGDCGTQRNLSEDGRRQAAAAGAWFRGRGLVPLAVRSSRWCRCLDTATLAFGQAEPWPPLDSFFEDRDTQPAQTRALAQALASIPAGRFEVWVSHMVNIAAFTGESLASGEALLARPAGPRAASGAPGLPQNLGRLPL